MANNRHNWQKLQSRQHWEKTYAELKKIQSVEPLLSQDMKPRLVKKPSKGRVVQ